MTRTTIRLPESTQAAIASMMAQNLARNRSDAVRVAMNHWSHTMANGYDASGEIARLKRGLREMQRQRDAWRRQALHHRRKAEAYGIHPDSMGRDVDDPLPYGAVQAANRRLHDIVADQGDRLRILEEAANKHGWEL